MEKHQAAHEDYVDEHEDCEDCEYAELGVVELLEFGGFVVCDIYRSTTGCML